jgi:hypothetical protein
VCGKCPHLTAHPPYSSSSRYTHSTRHGRHAAPQDVMCGVRGEGRRPSGHRERGGVSATPAHPTSFSEQILTAAFTAAIALGLASTSHPTGEEGDEEGAGRGGWVVVHAFTYGAEGEGGGEEEVEGGGGRGASVRGVHAMCRWLYSAAACLQGVEQYGQLQVMSPPFNIDIGRYGLNISAISYALCP